MLGVAEIVRPMKACYPECPPGSQQCLFKKKCLAQKEMFGAWVRWVSGIDEALT